MAYEKLESPKSQERESPVCAWNDHGDNCRHPGAASYATNGTGPWYCREHWYRLRGFAGMEGKKGNQLPTEIHSHAVEILQAKLKSRRFE